MKTLVTGAVLLMLCLSALPAGAAREDYTGRITFRDGTVLTYTWLSVRRDEIPCGRDLSDMKDYRAGSIRLLLPAIARIDFDNSAAATKQIASALPGYQADAVRKTTRVRVPSAGLKEDYRDSYLPSLCRDGRSLVFGSDAGELKDTTSGYGDILVYDQRKRKAEAVRSKPGRPRVGCMPAARATTPP